MHRNKIANELFAVHVVPKGIYKTYSTLFCLNHSKKVYGKLKVRIRRKNAFRLQAVSNKTADSN